MVGHNLNFTGRPSATRTGAMLPVCVRSRCDSKGYSFLRPPASGVALQAVRGPETRSAQAYSPKCLEGVFSVIHTHDPAWPRSYASGIGYLPRSSAGGPRIVSRRACQLVPRTREQAHHPNLLFLVHLSLNGPRAQAQRTFIISGCSPEIRAPSREPVSGASCAADPLVRTASPATTSSRGPRPGG